MLWTCYNYSYALLPKSSQPYHSVIIKKIARYIIPQRGAFSFLKTILVLVIPQSNSP